MALCSDWLSDSSAKRSSPCACTQAVQEKPEPGQESPSLPRAQPRGSQAQAANKQSLGRNLSPAFWGGFYMTRVTQTRAADVTIYHFISKGINIARAGPSTRNMVVPTLQAGRAPATSLVQPRARIWLCVLTPALSPPSLSAPLLSLVLSLLGDTESALPGVSLQERTAGQAGAQHPAVTPLPDTSPYLDADCPLARAGSDRTLLHPGRLPQLSALPQSQAGALHCR